MRLGNGTEVDEAPLRDPVLSMAHTVDAPRPALNSWAPYSAMWPVMEPDHVKVMVEAPVVVTLPYQSSASAPTEPLNCTALVQVVTPPPETDVTVVPVALLTWAKTASTSPTVLGDTAKVVRADPSAEAKVPTAVMTVEGTLKVNWSAGSLMAEVFAPTVTVTSTVAAPSAGEVAVMDPALLTVKLVAATVPNFTALAPVKLVPEMVTEVPPAVDPVVGLTPVTVGGGGTREGELVGGLVDGRGVRSDGDGHVDGGGPLGGRGGGDGRGVGRR